MPVSTGRDEKAASEINDMWFTVAKGSEDFSFKAMRRNLYEEALFKCEDERFEVDVHLNCCIRCEQCLSVFYQEAINASKRGEIYEIKSDFFKTPKFKLIAKIYGDSGPVVMAKLEADPIQAIPLVLTRVIQKKEEFLAKRAEHNKTWKDNCEKNYYKSLDLKVYYFKQDERKHINLKGNFASFI
jgi:paired amphipathic helix protein Sin3a